MMTAASNDIFQRGFAEGDARQTNPSPGSVVRRVINTALARVTQEFPNDSPGLSTPRHRSSASASGPGRSIRRRVSLLRSSIAAWCANAPCACRHSAKPAHPRAGPCARWPRRQGLRGPSGGTGWPAPSPSGRQLHAGRCGVTRAQTGGRAPQGICAWRRSGSYVPRAMSPQGASRVCACYVAATGICNPCARSLLSKEICRATIAIRVPADAAGRRQAIGHRRPPLGRRPRVKSVALQIMRLGAKRGRGDCNCQDTLGPWSRKPR